MILLRHFYHRDIVTAHALISRNMALSTFHLLLDSVKDVSH